MIQLSQTPISRHRELAMGKPLAELVAYRFGKPPRFEVVSQRWLVEAGALPIVERFSLYAVEGRPVSLHLVRFRPEKLPASFVSSFMGGERLGALLEREGWRRRGLEVSFFSSRPQLFASLPWRNRSFPVFPAWVRRFWVGEEGQRVIRVWEVLPATLWTGESGGRR